MLWHVSYQYRPVILDLLSNIMIKRISGLVLLVTTILSTPIISKAQADLFGEEKTPQRKGFIIAVNGNFDIPGADMAKRFGLSYRIGPAILYKTKSNWMFGAKGDFILGGKIKEDSLMYNIRDNDGSFLNNSGQRVGVGIFERGYAVGLEVGKIISIRKSDPNTGILVMTGAGFVQHKINIFDKDKTIPQLLGDYRKGYDRLTNGWYLEQFVGYNHFDKNGFFNFHIGADVLAGFTKSRRDFQYDLMRRDDKSRVDLLFGLRGGIYIPIFKKKSEETFYE